MCSRGIYFIRLYTARYSLFVLKVALNINKTNKMISVQPLRGTRSIICRHPLSTTLYISENHQSLISLCITLSLESLPVSFRQPCINHSPDDVTCSPLSPPSVRHAFTISLQAQNSPFSQIFLPTQLFQWHTCISQIRWQLKIIRTKKSFINISQGLLGYVRWHLVTVGLCRRREWMTEYYSFWRMGVDRIDKGQTEYGNEVPCYIGSDILIGDL